MKTAEDPCPTGFRVPTIAQWLAVLANNSSSTIGTNWISSATNYTSGRFVGSALMLPAAGNRLSNDGALVNRGYYGLYLSSTEYRTTGYAWILEFNSVFIVTFYSDRTGGFSVRCAAE